MPVQTDTTILVVDDDPDVLATVSEVLSEMGYQVHRASCGQAALDIIKNSPVDLLLTDVVMQPPDGIEIAAKAVEVQPNIKVVLTSGYAVRDLLQPLPRNCFFLPKPFRLNDLEQAIRESLAAQILA